MVGRSSPLDGGSLVDRCGLVDRGSIVDGGSFVNRGGLVNGSSLVDRGSMVDRGGLVGRSWGVLGLSGVGHISNISAVGISNVVVDSLPSGRAME